MPRFSKICSVHGQNEVSYIKGSRNFPLRYTQSKSRLNQDTLFVQLPKTIIHKTEDVAKSDAQLTSSVCQIAKTAGI